MEEEEEVGKWKGWSFEEIDPPLKSGGLGRESIAKVETRDSSTRERVLPKKKKGTREREEL